MTMRVIISGGGTGGHIFPALSIANELKKQIPDVEILFVGALGKMEMERVPAAGYKIVGLPVMGLPRKPSLKLFTFLWMLYKSMQKARQVIREFKPDVAIGVGGFASGPVLKAAVRKGVPAILQEQNSYAGVTNKLLAAKVRKICVAYPDMGRYFPSEKIVLTGNPVRQNLLEPVDKAQALEAYKLEANKPVIFVVGGSLGARSLNESVMANLDLIAKSGVQLVWQTGKFYYKEMLQRLEGKQPANLQAVEFLSNMDMAYKAADLVISRAGAGTISELCLLGIPCVLMPSPNVAEDHQTKNAMALVNNDAAVMVRDAEGPQKLFKEALSLVKDQDRLAALSANIKQLAKPNATSDIVHVILEEVKNK